MIRVSVILICLALLTACNKNQIVPTTVTIISTNHIDTFTLTDNGVTYIDTEISFNFHGAEIVLSKQGSLPQLEIYAPSNAQFPVTIQLNNVPGPSNGIGLFSVTGVAIAPNADFTEKYDGGEGYTITDAAINITTDSATKVFGTYQFTVTNIAGSKTVTGTIKCYHARREL